MKYFRHGAAAASGRGIDVWYPLPRRGVRVVDGAALEKRCAKAPRVRIPPSPPQTRPSDRPAGATSVGFAVRGELRERSPSGLWRRTGNAVRGNPSRVRIPPSPPPTRASRTFGRALASPALAHAPSSALAPVLDAAFARTPGRRADAPLESGRTSGRALASPVLAHAPSSALAPRANGSAELSLGPR